MAQTDTQRKIKNLARAMYTQWTKTYGPLVQMADCLKEAKRIVISTQTKEAR